MITIKNNSGQEYTFVYSQFPDKTSQAWQINPVPKNELLTVTWMFENEAELVTILQLGALIKKLTLLPPTLNVPYMVYGRQDKEITNESTFAKEVFLNAVKPYYGMIKTYDAHSDDVRVQSESPQKFFTQAALDCLATVVCFPDKGAKTRYEKLFPEEMPKLYADKVRNQLTGEIEGLELVIPEGVTLTGRNVLVCDDLIDGGRTFTELAKCFEKLPEIFNLNLAVSHGLFTKGLDIIYKAGYNKIYTTNSLKKWELEAGKDFVWYNGEITDYELTVIKVV